MTGDSLRPPPPDTSARGEAETLLAELRRQRVEVMAEGEQLRLKAPRGAVSAEQRRALGRLKPWILELLAGNGGAPTEVERREVERRGVERRGVERRAAETPARGEVEGALPPIERGLWFLARLAPEDPAYNVALVVELEGSLDGETLTRAVAGLVARQPILRTTFAATAEGPRWRVGPPPATLVERTAAVGWDPDRRHAWVDASLERPFDLESGPVFRTAWLDGDGHHLLVLTWHHLVGDARSAALVLRELERGFDPSLPPGQTAGAPFRNRRDAEPASALDWWRERLTPLPPRLDLPTDRRRAETVPRGDCLARRLDPELVTTLRALGRRFDATLFMVGAAIVQLHLARLSGLSRIALATPVDQRDARSADAIGLQVNPVILDTDLAGAEDFGQLLRRARHTALEAFERASVPLGELVRILAPPRDGTRHPLVSVMFNVADLEGIRLEIPGCRSRVSLVEPGARFDLTIYWLLDGADTRLEIAWNRDLFDRSRIEGMLHQLEYLMTQVAMTGGAERPLDHLLLARPTRRPAHDRQPVEERTSHRDEPAQHRALTQLRGSDRPTAIEDASGSWGPRRLAASIQGVCRALGQRGVGPGEVVVVEGRRSASFVAATLGVLEAGAALAVLDPALPVARLARSIEGWHPVAWVRSEPATEDCVLVGLGEGFPEIPRITVPMPPELDDADPAAVPPGRWVGGQSLAWVPSTSGTTGEPRVIATPHGPLARFLDWACEALDLGGDDRFALLAGLGHDPILRDILLPLSLGATLVCPPTGLRRDGRALARWLDHQRITAVHLTPALAELLTLADRPLPGLRSIALGGDRSSQRLARALHPLAPKARMINVYGTTETPQVVAWHRITPADLAPDAPTTLPIGRGIPAVELQVIAADGVELAGLGELGEVAVAGDQLARGILGDPATTAARFVPDPSGAPGTRRYRTGDLGRTRPDGSVVLAGRRDRQIQMRGSRLEPGEIEALLLADPAIVAAAVSLAVAAPAVPSSDSSGGAAEPSRPLTAWIVPRGEESTSDLVARLGTHLRSHLPEALVPSRIVRIDSLPLTANGKVDFVTLTALEAPPPPAPESAPPNPRELAMATLWGEVLGIREVPRHASFFELGGHSLLVPRLLDRVRDVFGSAPSLATLFRRPTVAALLEAVEAGDAVEILPRPPLRRRAPREWRPSPSQRRLWFLHRLDPTSPAYHLARALRLRGTLDLAALDVAFVELLIRHHGLRSGWVERDGEPRPVLLPLGGSPVARIDLSSLATACREREAAHRIDCEARRPFDLGHELPLRATLLVLDRDHHVLLLTLHHLAADAASIAILAHELSRLYRARLEARPSRLEPLAHTPGDVTTYLAETEESSRHDTDLAWWAQRLAEAPTLDLPFARPARARRRGAVCRRALPDTLLPRLEEAARHHATTPFVFLLSAWKLLLARLGRDWDVVVGTAIQNRPREAEGLIGLFLDTLPLRTRLAPEDSLGDLVRRVHGGLLESLVHQGVGFARLVESSIPRRDLRVTPFFQAFFNLVDTREHRFELAGLDVEALPRREDLTVKLDLGLHAVRNETGLDLLLIYDAHRFETEAAEVLLRQLELLLDQALAEPTCRLGDFDLLLPDENPVLAESSQPASPEPTQPIASVESWVAKTPEASALRFAEVGTPEVTTRTYGELGRAIDRLASSLRNAGVLAGERVAIQGHRDPSVVVALLAVWRIGGVVLLVDRALPVARRRRMASKAELDFVIDWAPDTTPWHDVAAQRVLTPDPHALFGFDSDEEPPPNSEGSKPREREEPHRAPDAPAYLVFTSGSTGEPKGLVGSHRALGHFFAWQRETFAIGPGDRVALLATLSFDAVLRDILLPLTSGATLCIPPPDGSAADPELGAWLARERITVVHRVPSLARAQLASTEPKFLPDLRWLFLVGELVHEGLVRDLEDRTEAGLVNLYGPTETTLIQCFHRIGRSGPSVQGSGVALVPVGRPLPETRILVLDERARPRGVGEVGEVWIQTPHRTLGAVTGDPDPFRPAVPELWGSSLDDRCYPTGDLGYRRPDGTLVILGRRDGQLKIHGVRIEPGEVESALEALPEIEQAVVVGPRSTVGPRLVAYFVSELGMSVDPAALRRALRARLPESLVPTRFVPVDALPRTVTGKIDRRALTLRPIGAPAVDATGAPPHPGPETSLAKAWQAVLDLDRQIHRNDDFFALGGHSLLATRLLARLRASTGPLAAGAGHPEALRNLFEAPELADQAKALLVLAETHRATHPEATIGGFPRAQGDEHPLSFHQRRLWFLERFEEAPGAYHVARSLPLRGPLDPAALEAALTTLVWRHGVLRTRLIEHGDEAVQRVANGAHRWLQTVDLSHLDPVRRHSCRHQLLTQGARRPFDLAAGRLFRATLIDLGRERGQRCWELSLVFHHLAVDAPSLETFAHELAVLYDATRGRSGALPDPLPALPLTYADYAAWQRHRFADDEVEGLVEAWRRRLEGASPLELPTDRPRPNHGAHRAARHPVPLTGVEVADLEALGQRHRASLFMVLAALFQVLLQRLTGQRDVSLGTPVNQRPHPDLEPLMGFFANSLVLRGRRVGDPSFVRWLDQVREDCLDAYAHQDLPFEVLVAALDPERDPGRNPLFQCLLALHQRPAEPLGLPGLEASPIVTWGSVARVDLQWVVVVEGSRLRSHFEASADLFEATTVRRWGAALGRLTRAVLDDPRRRLSTLPLLDRGERHQLLHGWNDTRRWLDTRQGSDSQLAAELDTDLASLIRRQAERTPDAVAVEAEGAPLSYSELVGRANQVSRALIREGLPTGGRVAVAIERSHELLIALVGILGAGAAYVPLDPSYPEPRLRRVLDDARPFRLLTCGPFLDGVPVPQIDLRDDARRLARLPTTPPERPIAPLDLAYVIFTSGSTGRPKGVMCGHRAVVNRLWWMQQRFPIDSCDRVLQKTPIGFDVSVWELFWPLLVGARVVMARPEGHKDTAYLRRILAERRISTLHFVPSMLRVFVEEGGLAADEPEHPTTLRRVFTSGEALPRDLANRFLTASAAELHNLYGPTEAAVDVTWEPLPRPAPGAVALGRPITNLRTTVVDARLRPQPIGVVGELVLGGLGLARGYLDRPALTALALVPDPLSGLVGERLYRTGDRVRQRPDGRLDFLGRLDHQVKVRGFRIELGDIETHLVEHPEVSQAVAALDDDRLVAWCVAAADRGLTPESLRHHLADRLPEAMVPTAIVVLDELPLLPNGKVDRKHLPEVSATRTVRRLGEPESPLETLLAEIWTDVLARPVGRNDNFFELGGDSILALRIVARARPRGLDLKPRDLFDHQTLADLARWVVEAGRQRDEASPRETGPVVGPARWTPIQHHFFETLGSRRLDHPAHFNWTRLWRVTRPFAPTTLRRLASHLEHHHDALRSRFPRSERPLGRLRIIAPAEPPATWIDLSRLEPHRARAVLERACAQTQTSLDLENGPLWRLVGLAVAPGGEGPGPRLLLVAHHLVVDGVSWSVLTEDLATLLEGNPLPDRSTSFVTWTEALSDGARDSELASTLEAWMVSSRDLTTGDLTSRDLTSHGRPRRSDGTHTPRPDADPRPHRLRRDLDPTFGRRLRHHIHRHRLRIDEVLLTALALVLRSDFGPRLVFDLEGHGREPLRAGLDASRTVGWLTALYPIVLDLQTTNDVGFVLRTIKETLRTVPLGGVPFGVFESLGEPGVAPGMADLPPRQIVFNYLGSETDPTNPQRPVPTSASHESGSSPPLLVAEESAGATRGPRVGPSHPLELVAALRGDVLGFEVSWWPERWAGPEVAELADRCLDRLDEILAWLETPEARCHTPSDFPLAGLDTSTLERQFVAAGSAAGVETPIEDLYPTSATQEAILYYHLYHPHSTAYFDHTSFLLEGPVDPERVRRAGQLLLDHHPILRTTVRWQGLDEPLQVVWRRAELPFDELDWRAVDTRRHDAQLRRFIEQDRRRGCDLSRPPLLRWTLIRLGSSRYRLVWSYHHLILDGWSLPLLLHDFYRAYREPAVPLPATRPFRDYIAWLALHDRERAAPFWRRALRGFTEATPLPFDRPPRDSESGPVVRGHGHSLAPDASNALTRLAQQARVTLNTVVQGAWALVLSRYSGQREVLFGATLAGRPPEVSGIEAMVGLFVNTLPVRVDTTPELGVRGWLAALQHWNVEMRGVDDSRLFDLHRWSGVPPGRPLFESALLFQSYPRQDGPVLADLGIVSHGFRAFGHTSYPLTLTAKPRRRLLLQLAWDTLRFDATTARRMLAALVHALEELSRCADGRLGDLRRLPVSEQQQLLHETNDRPRARLTDEEADPISALRHRARLTPDDPAVVSDGKVVLSYGELTRRMERLADLLVSSDVGPETPVGVFVTRSPEMVVAVLAVLAVGAAYVPLDPLHPPGRLAWILEEMGIRWILTQRKLVGDLPSVDARPLAVDGLGHTEPTAANDELRLLAEAMSAKAPTARSGGHLSSSGFGDALAYVLYTSGSTGRPKAVGIRRRALATYCRWAQDRFGLGPGRRMLQFASLGFDTSAEEIFPTLASGATLVLRNERMLESPATFLATLERWGIDVLDLPTAYWHQLCATLGPSTELPARLRTVILGGEAVQPTHLARWQTLGQTPRLLNTYGPTEGTIVAGDCDLVGEGVSGVGLTGDDVSAEARSGPEGPGDVPAASISIGRPLPGTTWFVVDRRLEPAPLGAAGELCLGGDRLARGYLHRPAQTARSFVPDPWAETPGARLYRTGDRVRTRADGELLFLGRIDHQVKVRGLRIELGEVETVLADHPRVKEAVASVVDSAGLRPRLVAHVVPSDQDSEALQLDAVRAKAKTQLPFYMLPAEIFVVPTLPRTASGKVDRRQLATSVPRATPRPRSHDRPSAESPREGTEEALAELFAEILGFDDPEGADLGRDDEYFDLGGDSLLAVRLMARIERRFGVPLTLAELFADFTIAGLARRVAAARGDTFSTPTVEEVPRTSTAPSKEVPR